MTSEHPLRAVPTSVESLSPHARALFTACLDATDPLWDPDVALLENPSAGTYDVRASVRYALGLLVRAEGDDRERAVETLRAVLDNQYVAEPDAVYYGTWARTPDEHGPIDDPVVWEEYDPNWREFVGSNLALVHDAFGHAIPDRLRTGIAEANRTATLGTLERDVSPGYTNIAAMRAFLVLWTADRFDERAWEATADAFADRIYDRFAAGEAFCEFNSPTYAGVTMNALGHWLTSPRAERLRERGAEMEAALWKQLAAFYHAGLQTLCGPYERAYAMDTRRSITDYYVWLAAGGTARKPFPESHHTAMPGNYGSGLLTALLGGWSALPAGTASQFRSFQGERRVEYRIGCPERTSVATAWLGETVVLGGFAVETGDPPDQDGRHAATMHWRVGDDDIGWLRARPDSGTDPDARAQRNALAVEGRDPGPLTFELSAPGLETDAVAADAWDLPGLAVNVSTNAVDLSVTRDGGRIRCRYDPPADDRLTVELSVRERD